MRRRLRKLMRDAMHAETYATFFCPTRLTMGVGCWTRIPELVRQHGCTRLFAAVDTALLGSDFYLGIEKTLHDAGIAVCVFSDIEPEPSAHTVHRAFDACQQHGASMSLAIGGGSTIDTAKAVGILATNGGRIQDYEGIAQFTTPGLPLIALPSTAGTGSEVSGSCTITDSERQRKMSIRHATLNPATYALLDPLALRTLPAHVAAHAGVDAFVHAFESYLSRQASPFTDALNVRAIDLIAANIRPFVANRENPQAAQAMLCGAAMAGMTFGQTGLGNVHCMARFVGPVCKTSHGLSNAVCLPVVARFNLLANPAKYAQIAAAMDCPVQGMPQLEAAWQAVRAIERLCQDLGIPARLRDIGATEPDLDHMATQCSQADYNRWNPRHSTRDDFLSLFKQAY